MAKIKIEYPDGSKKEHEKGITGLDIAKDISEGLGRAALAIVVNDKATDLTTPITTDSKIRILTFHDKEGVDLFRHSSAHVLAMAVKDLYPETKLTIGPAVEEGFYYDFDVKENFTPEDLKKIEEKMKDIVHSDIPFERLEVSRDEAIKEMKKRNETYKVEMIKEFPEGETISLYKNNDFIDPCRGPHVPSTKYIKAFKLTKLAGAYWKGDAKNKQLQRVYGISFPDKKLLKEYLKVMEEAEKRDHKKIGKELDLFSFHEEGPGFPFFHHKGMVILNRLIDFWRKKHYARGYQEIKTPMVLGRELWETSGHWKLYKDNMYTTKIDEKDFAIKPMNCPGGMLVYKETIHSYRELPLRVGELGHVHRHELSGVLNGLFRVRSFTQDDAHIFCSDEQLEDEIIDIVKLIKEMYEVFGFKEYKFTLSIRGEKKKDKYLGTDKDWDWAQGAILNALKKLNLDCEMMEGEAKFYGPSLDVQIRDALGREWQCSTIQLDFNLPSRFDITYEGKYGKKHTPFILHRVVYGSLERFFGILVEHFAGKFPLWISPNQVKILTVADRHEPYAEKIADDFKKNDIMVEVDSRSESIPKKVRNAQLEQFNYILVVGDNEESEGTVSVRTRDNNVEGTQKIDAFLKRILIEINEKKL
ncbi:MAG: threonine--tRNA ligase [Candidatus Woesearchaeota archaeon]